MIGHLVEIIKSLVFILPKMSGYVSILKVKGRDMNNKLISLSKDDYKVLLKYKNIWTKIEDLNNVELIALTV